MKRAASGAIPGLAAIYMAAGDLQLQGQTMLLVLLALAAMGYYLPNFVLARLIARRQGELFENLPDALDLMRICVEAGLGIDAAIARVGEELRIVVTAIANGVSVRQGVGRRQ